MVRKWFAWLFGTNANPEKFLDVLQAARTRNYTSAERYSDFRMVFMGHSSPEQGQRVLAEIFKEGMMFRNGLVAGDPQGTAGRAGKRDLCVRIMAIMNADPEKEK